MMTLQMIETVDGAKAGDRVHFMDDAEADALVKDGKAKRVRFDGATDAWVDVPTPEAPAP